MAHYDFTPQFSATLNVYNVTDRKYINSLYIASYYAAPRSYTASQILDLNRQREPFDAGTFP